jgi:hypothetical protein
VVPGRPTAQEVVATVKEGGIATVTIADAMPSSGVIHVMNTVLLPC